MQEQLAAAAGAQYGEEIYDDEEEIQDEVE